MAKYQKVYLRVVGRIGDTPLDVDKFPDRVLAVGTAYLKPNIKEGYAENVIGPDGIEELEIPTPINLTIDNGWLTYNGDPYIWLKVSEEGWNWNLSFPQLRINGTSKKLNEFNFELQAATEIQIQNSELPQADPSHYWGVNLASLVEFPDPSTGVKVSKGDTGWSIVSAQVVGDDKFQFVTNNPDAGSRYLPPVTIPAFTDLKDDVLEAAAIAATASGVAGNKADEAADSADEAADYSLSAGSFAASAEISNNQAEGFKNAATTQAGIATTKAQEAAASAEAAAQAVLGDIPNGSIGTIKLSPDVNTSLGKADTASQPGHLHTVSALSDASPLTQSFLQATAGQAARNIIGAGTSNLAIGTTASTAAAGNDSRLSNTRTPSAASIVNSMVAAAAAIDPAKIAGTAVVDDDARLTNNRVSPDNSVTSAQIVDGSIVNADINVSAGIAISKLETGRVKAFNNTTPINSNIVFMTEAQYAAIGTKDPNTMYVRG